MVISGRFLCKKVLLLIEIKTQTLAKCVDLSTCEFDIVIKLTSPIQTHSPPWIKLTHLTICTPSRTHSCTPKPLERHPTLPPHHWLVHLPTHTSTPSLTCTPTHPPHHFLMCTPTHPQFHPIALWFAHLPTYTSTLSLTCTPTHPIALTCPPTHPHVHPITDLYTYPPHCSDLPTYPPTCPPYHWLAYLPTHTSTPSLTCTPPHPPHRWFAHLPTHTSTPSLSRTDQQCIQTVTNTPCLLLSIFIILYIFFWVHLYSSETTGDAANSRWSWHQDTHSGHMMYTSRCTVTTYCLEDFKLGTPLTPLHYPLPPQWPRSKPYCIKYLAVTTETPACRRWQAMPQTCPVGVTETPACGPCHRPVL